MVYLNITLSNKPLPPFWQLSVGKAAGRGMNSEKLLQAVCAVSEWGMQWSFPLSNGNDHLQKGIPNLESLNFDVLT